MNCGFDDFQATTKTQFRYITVPLVFKEQTLNLTSQITREHFTSDLGKAQLHEKNRDLDEIEDSRHHFFNLSCKEDRQSAPTS